MAGFTRKLHPVSTFAWGKLRAFVPDMTFDTGADEDEPMALMLLDPDQEQHIFVFNEEGRQKLLAALTGGFVIA
jgi:hypothetical protein